MDQILFETSEMPPENVLEGLCKNRLQGSEQNQTAFSMYNLELSRDRVVKAELSKSQEHVKTTCWPDDQDAQFQSRK